MYYDDEPKAVNFFAGMLLGVVIGASLALLTAPQSGRRTRRRLLRAVSSARDSAGERWLDLAGEDWPSNRHGGRVRA
ncbi:MAG TPA: YtxH domain-containing protein [Longimicrobiales bacterium]|nr:YtxH domain-containing protein [Longimicrobiales bacterium]